jgi:phospholipid/cholesterol/gamma-HCH transport system substrate-binding protein
MKFSIRFADKIVGVLFILAIAMLIVVIFMLGKNQRWFEKDLQYISYFKSARGLSVNMNVQYKGFTIGHVKKIELNNDKGEDEDMVKVSFTIFKEHEDRVKEGSIVELQASPVGLGNSFVFYPGKGIKLVEFSEIPERYSTLAAEHIHRGLADKPVSEDKIGTIIDQVTETLATVNVNLSNILGKVDVAVGDISEEIKKIKGQLDPLLDDLNTKVPRVMTNVTSITDKIAAPQGTVMTILDNNGPVLTNLTEVLNNITSIMGSLEKTINFVPAQLPQVAILLSNLQSALVEAEKLIIAINNNPLLKGGVPEQKETGPGAATPRDLDFKH